MFSIQRGQKKEIPVILPKHATAAENFAAEELKTVLEQVFQAETIYLAENSPFIDGCISIGETELMKKNFSQIYDGLETDDCAVACKNNTLFLFGKTDDFSSAGTIYAVYEFAERWLGVRYLAWDESFYPPRQELALEEMLHVSRPDFILRQYLAAETRKSPAFTARLRLKDMFVDNTPGGNAYPLIAEGKKSDAQVGRRAVGLKMDPRYGWAIGLNISRRAYAIGIVDFSGKILREFCKEISMNKKPAALLDDICAHIREMSAGMVGKFLGIGITMPGPLDRERGVLLRVPNMREWENFAVSEYFERRFHCAVVLDNNSNAAAKAEEVYNPAVQGKNFMELIVDSGLGSSIILNADNHSVCFDCEFGHSCIDINGERCSCGNIGCAEMYASANAILAFVSKKGGTFGTWKDIADGFLLNDELCKLAVERERYYLSRVIINAVNSFPLEAVVFSGDIVYRFEKLFAESLKQEVFEGSIKNNRVQMFVSAMKNTPVLAAANLIMENCLYFDSAQC